MGVFKVSQYLMMQLWITRLLCLLGWVCNITLAQLEISEAITGSTGTFPDIGITWMANSVVFVASIFKGRLDLEIGARDVLALLRGPKLDKIDGFGLTTCEQTKDASVVMLSAHPPNSSMRQFMKYTYHAHHVHSIILKCWPLRSPEVPLTSADQICNCSGTCKCIVFKTVEDITVMLAFQIPGTLKRMSDSHCLLPSLSCLRNGCHGCNRGLLHVEGQRLIESDSVVEHPAAVCEILDSFPEFTILGERNCICIPVKPAGKDDWTKMLIRSLQSKDKEARGVSGMASEALENYIAQSGGRFKQAVEYRTVSLIVPRLTEVLINILLTAWFRVDGLSSALVARRAIKDYVVDTKGTGFAASAFVTKAMVMSNSLHTNVCQVLTFRGNLLNLKSLSFVVGFVNIICCISWTVLVAFEGGTGKWYDTHSVPPTSVLRVTLIMSAIGMALGMDCLHVYLNRRVGWRKVCLVWAVIMLEIMCIVIFGAVARTWGLKGFGRWVFSVMEGMVWIKWGIGSYLLGEYASEHESGVFRTSFPYPVDEQSNWIKDGILVYSSAFWINSSLAAARTRAKWEHSPAT